MPVDLLIDGYNLMHFAGLARARYAPGDLHQARTRLLKQIRRGLSTKEISRTTVVFDAQYARHVDSRTTLQQGMRVLFSEEGREADDLIEELISYHTSPKRLLVISSDNRLRRAARAARAGIVDAASFLSELERREFSRGHQEITDERPEKTQSDEKEISSRELEAWMNEFQNIDVEKIAREIQKETIFPELPKPKSTTVLPPESVARKSTPKSVSAKPVKASKKKPTQQADPKSQQGSTVRKGRKKQKQTFFRLPEPVKPTSSEMSEVDVPQVTEPELSFWEQRIAELIEEEKRNRKR